MNHLTDEQLSALLDDALAPPARATCDAHLASCEACRAKLAELSSLDAALKPALTHDAGEAYFATFAERVGARIAAGGASEEAPAAPAMPASPAPRRSPWAWFISPRGLSLAGGTAALLITAGLAWMRFEHEIPHASLMRAAAPNPLGARVREPVTSSLAIDSVAPQPAAPTNAPEAQVAPALAAPALQSRDERAPAARGDAGSGRAREVKTLANGESVPVRRQPQMQQLTSPAPAATESRSTNSSRPAEEASGTPAQEPAPVTAQMKQRAMAKGSEAPASKPAERSLWNSAKKLFTPPPPAASPSALAPTPEVAPQKDALASGFAKVTEKTRNEVKVRGEGSSVALKPQLADAAPLAIQCGTVSDTRGTPVKGVQITLLGASTRSSRSAPDGSFCLPQAVAGDTLILMHVGFEPVRVVLTASTSLAFGLEPVGTLGQRDGMFVGGRAEGLLKLPPAAAGLAPAGTAPAPDVYAGEPDTVRTAVATARERTALAHRDRTAAQWESAASSWDAIAAMTSGHASYDARFQSLSALRESWLVGPTRARRERLQAVLVAFVAATPRTLPERATVLRWQGELRTSAPR